MELISKAEAVKRGINYYFTGKPCKRGHIARRLLSSPHCTECKLEKRKQYYATHIEQQRAKGRKYHHDNREANLLKMSKWLQDNKEAVNARNRAYRAEHREKFNAINKAWREKNSAYILFRNACRKKHIKRATPGWANMAKIKAIYIKAVNKTEATGTQYHVDHIIPLRGRNVCGLHVETNLRVILAKENLVKGNKL